MTKTIIAISFFMFCLINLGKTQTNSAIWIDENIRLIHLKDSIFMHTTWEKNYEYSKGYGGSNGMLVIKNGQAIMVDTPVEEEKTQQLTKYLKDSLSVNVTKFIAGHYHPDCVGGLNHLKSIGVESIANHMTISTCKKVGMPVPEIAFTDSLNFDFNGLKIQCRYFGGGHTFDNITVFVPEKKVLFGGCLIKSLDAERIGVVPNQSVLSEWDLTVVKILKAYKGSLTVIPGHGNFGTEQLLTHTVDLAVKKKNQ